MEGTVVSVLDEKVRELEVLAQKRGTTWVTYRDQVGRQQRDADLHRGKATALSILRSKRATRDHIHNTATALLRIRHYYFENALKKALTHPLLGEKELILLLGTATDEGNAIAWLPALDNPNAGEQVVEAVWDFKPDHVLTGIPAVRWKTLQHPKCPPQRLAANAVQHSSTRARESVAANPNLARATQLRLATDSSSMVRRALVNNPAVDPTIADNMAKRESSSSVIAALIKRGNRNPQLLERAIATGGLARHAVAKHCSGEYADQVASDGSSLVRKAALKNEHVSDEAKTLSVLIYGH